MSISLRLLEDADLAEADAVILAAFGRTTSVQPMLRLHRAVEPEGFWVAEEQGRIIGTVGSIDYGPLSYITLMTVDPSQQRRGIGRLLMERALGWLNHRGCPVVLLDATDQGAPLYETLGFSDDSTAYLFERSEVSGVPGAPRQSLLAVDADPAELARFDAPYFGANREKVLRALVVEHHDRCLVARDVSGNLTGYLFARDPVLGPWVATSQEVAEDLLSTALALSSEHTPQVLVPRSNHFCASLLRRFGFAEQRSLRHMRCGGKSPPGQPIHLFGQTSFGHG